MILSNVRWKKGIPFVIGVITVLVAVSVVCCKKSVEPGIYHGLHYTGEGMRHWYEDEGGFMDITGIPYQELDCKSCHVKSCDACHNEMNPDKISKDTITRARKMEVCLKCHSREKVTMKLGKVHDTLDVHFASGMGCVDCHDVNDIHGRGKDYHSMRDRGAVSTRCVECHRYERGTFAKTKSHLIHDDRLSCEACHVQNTVTCSNCHFNNFLKTGKRKGSFIPPAMKWLLLINYDDGETSQVTTGNVQTLVYGDKKFISYVPYYTHAINREGRKCEDCHGNEAIQKIGRGEKIDMIWMDDGEIKHWEGVVPVVDHDRLHWTFFDLVDGKWVPLEDYRDDVTVQYAGHGSPLTARQLESLSKTFKSSDEKQ